MARTSAQIQTELDAALTARLEVITEGASVSGDGAGLTRASLSDLTTLINQLQRELAIAESDTGNECAMIPTVGA